MQAETIILLIRDERVVTDMRRAVATIRPTPQILVPPVRGLAFFADSAVQAAMNAWWSDVMPDTDDVLWVIEHEPGLEAWLAGIDGDIIVGVRTVEAARAYRHLDRVRAMVARDATELMDDVLHDHAMQGDDRGRTVLAAARTSGVQQSAPPTAERMPDPFHLLASAGTLDDRDAAAAPKDADGATDLAPHVAKATPSPARSWGPAWLRVVSPRRAPQAIIDDHALGRDMAAHAPVIVAIGSRKGGVGKTSHAAGVAIAAGECLDHIGHRAAIVDANVANPDAWGQLSLQAQPPTVRQIVDAITAGREAPSPVHASTPALACFPESRETSEYTRLEVSRFAAHLRARYSFIVVDMSNRIPDPTGGPEAAVAAYWLQEADVLVLPTGSAKQDFNGVLDYLDVPNLPPVVVAYIPARTRRNRRHPLALQYVDAIRTRAAELVELPDEGERVRYAVLEGLPVQTVSPRLRLAYRRLTQAIVATATARR